MHLIKANRAVSAGIILMFSASAATAAPISNGTGNNNVTVEVTPNGSFSSANFNPAGPLPAGDTLYGSYIYFRQGSSSPRSLVSNSGANMVSNNGAEAISTFSLGSLKFTLTQTLSDLRDTGGAVIGSVLTQSYSFINNGASAIDFSLARYVDGQMNFGGASHSAAGGGTTLIDGSTRAVYETLKAVGLNDSTIFLGITSEGGNPLGYEVDTYGGASGHLSSGAALKNAVLNDLNGDGLVDAGKGYDTGIALENGFSIGAGQQGQWVTRTLFGSGPLSGVTFAPPVPEPGTWAMMIAGFGLVGASMRRKVRSVAMA